MACTVPYVFGGMSHTVSYETSHGDAIADYKTKPTAIAYAPECEGYTFAGWYTDEARTQRWDFETEVKRDLVLYDKWIIDAPEVKTVGSYAIAGEELCKITPVGSGQSVYYSDDQDTWTSTVPTATSSGTRTVYWKVVADACDDLAGSFTVTIALVNLTYLQNAATTPSALGSYSWNELKGIADDIATFGSESPAYSAAVAAARAGGYKPVSYSSSTMYATLIGVAQDVNANGNALGLSFMAIGAAPSTSNLFSNTDSPIKDQMNASDTNTGGWADCALRPKLAASSGSIAANFPSELKSVITPARKAHQPVYSSTSADVDYTTDFMWLLSYHEVYGDDMAAYYSSAGSRPWLNEEGEQYAWFSANGVSPTSYDKCKGGSTNRWLRSCYPNSASIFGYVGYSYGNPGYNGASNSRCVCPGFAL